MLVVKGNNAIVFGDRHVEDLYRGRHKNYRENSRWCMNKTLEMVKEIGVDCYMETGDLIGVRQSVSYLEDRSLLYEMVDFFRSLDVPCVVNKGNHDIHGGVSKNDYLFLNRLGCFHTPDSIEDSNGRVVKLETDYGMNVYIHFVPYGKEYEKLNPVKDSLNVAVTHGDFRIGSENFTNNKDAIDLVTHNAFFGMDIILNGHIHQPINTPHLVKFANGDEAQFMNLGCMARPKISENYTKCWAVEFGVKEGIYGSEPEFYFQPHIIDLLPPEEIFDMKKNVSEMIQEELDLEGNQKELETVVSDLHNFTWGGNSFVERVLALPINEDIKTMILDYIGG